MDWSGFKPKKSDAFSAEVEKLLAREGGEVNDPDDKGGHTKYGISQKAYPDEDIASLTPEKAKQIYLNDYWVKIGADSLPEQMRGIAFDAAVNQGVGWTRKALKEAEGDFNKFLQLRQERYDEIVEKNPSQRKFQRGWMNRLDEFRPSIIDWSSFTPKGTVPMKGTEPARQTTPAVKWSDFKPKRE